MITANCHVQYTHYSVDVQYIVVHTLNMYSVRVRTCTLKYVYVHVVNMLRKSYVLSVKHLLKCQALLSGTFSGAKRR